MTSLGDKPAGYYSQARTNLVDELPRPAGRVLDVGCGEGATAEALRAAGATWISGIEVVAEAAAAAAERYDEVVVGDALEMVDAVDGPFDTIVCYDVLEHLVDPGALLRRLHGLARPGAWLHVSVPNARHYSLTLDLVVRGTFGYAEYGHRDSTHLRWFTRGDMTRLLAAGGWRVERAVPSALLRLRELRVPVPAQLVSGLAGEFFARAWYILARRSA